MNQSFYPLGGGSNKALHTFDSDLNLVYMGPNRKQSIETFSFGVQEYKEKPVLSLWNGGLDPYIPGTGE